MAQTPQYLIRSASTLLSIIGQQVEQPRQSSDRHSVRFLDHVALLFPTGPGEDVSAVSAVLTGSGSILVRCTDSSDEDDQDAEVEIQDTGNRTRDTTTNLLLTKKSPRVRAGNSAAAEGFNPTGSNQMNGGQSENIDDVGDVGLAGQSAMYLLLFHSPCLPKYCLTSR